MLRDLKEDEEESEQPPAIAAIGSRPPSEGSASPPAFGFAGLGPRPPSPPLGRADEELRMLERFRTLEHIRPEEILSGPVAGIQLRRGAFEKRLKGEPNAWPGSGGDGVLEIRRIFEDGRRRTGAPKPPPLRAELPAFVRAAAPRHRFSQLLQHFAASSSMFKPLLHAFAGFIDFHAFFFGEWSLAVHGAHQQTIFKYSSISLFKYIIYVGIADYSAFIHNFILYDILYRYILW